MAPNYINTSITLNKPSFHGLHSSAKMQLTTTTTAALFTLLGVVSQTIAAPAPSLVPSSSSSSGGAIYNSVPRNIAIPDSNENKGDSTLQARIQFELERQTTFIQREIPVGVGRVRANLATVFSAFIVNVSVTVHGEDTDVDRTTSTVVCQGFDSTGQPVGRPITDDASFPDLEGGRAVALDTIECREL